ncbi:hypothetical protein A3I40_02125 [Candidatus Uhrbacteria bacterium RIFCSPLOWO2_02_FULL_48_12]|uniref:Uncharacterized protein n=1 Tax=Candidatus Uhrbacteria bacterium RIFCSPLOWO2_02_FULL_48_12 TaxID=1802407 RepID=A0A1F7VBS3_9BACT|nr:MAG: hypothetical protein A3I40_02125 [Candidatus Uhrbacteria bacterium RIFCSPLOWO2_02_FULL_48_12]
MSKPIIDVPALQLESRFSLPPNSLGYCGKDTAPEKFKACIISGECDGVEEEVAHFIVLHPYLKTLASIFDLPKLSYPVVEGYWIGNDYLKMAKAEHYDLLLKNFLAQGVPAWLVDELKQRRPKIFIPSHLFQVLHVGVGRASGAVPCNLDSMNNCMIRWGKVEKIVGGDAVINLNSLKKESNKHTLTVLKETVPFNSDLAPGLKTGDTVAVHWKQVIKILTPPEEKNLSFWTNQVLSSLV